MSHSEPQYEEIIVILRTLLSKCNYHPTMTDERILACGFCPECYRTLQFCDCESEDESEDETEDLEEVNDQSL